MSRWVMFQINGYLLLSDVVFADDGSVKSALVENGGWYYEAANGRCFAKDGYGRVVTEWPAPPEIEVFEIPHNKRGDYNQLLNWAESQRKGRP